MATVRRDRRALLRTPALAGVLAVALLFLAQGPAAHAANITVNTTDDELNADGDCSLREAIQAANTDAVVDACAAGSGADTIDVPAGTYTLAIAGSGEDASATGDLDISADLTITGAGAATTIIDGADLDRVFHILGGIADMSGLTIQNGSVSADGGGILNQGTLTLNSSTVSGNSAGGPGFGGTGGGIVNAGTLSLNSSTVSGNTASGQGGGIVNYSIAGTVALTNSTVSGNTADDSGGGILNYITAGTVTLINVTVSGNSGGFGGGGIRNSGFGTLTLTNSTVSGNSAATGGGVAGGTLAGGSTLKNTIVANNTGGDCSSIITSADHNLDSDNTCNLTAPGDIPGVDPMLGPLANNGGPTQTHALLTGSPAVDAGLPDTDPDCSGGDDFDQRGVARPLDGDGDGTPVCDIGAFEVETPPPACAGVVATITGTAGPDLLIGTSGSDIIVGLAGNDLIFAFGGNDLICADEGNDVIIAGGGNDIILAGPGDDVMAGGSGFDGCIGGAGTDTAVACEVTFGVP